MKGEVYGKRDLNNVLGISSRSKPGAPGGGNSKSRSNSIDRRNNNDRRNNRKA